MDDFTKEERGWILEAMRLLYASEPPPPAHIRSSIEVKIGHQPTVRKVESGQTAPDAS